MTNQTPAQILIVDDDEGICKTLSAILKAEGYQTTIATTGKEAIEKTKTHFYNLALLDIRLPDVEGTQLLAQLQKTTPETIKIMITGYPSLKNAVAALNLGADSYIMKPLDPAELLKTVRKKLEMRQEKERMTKEKLTKWIQSQMRSTRSSDFQEFLDKTATELADFGLTKTQAKVYISLIALGVASVSEIAGISKVRREEVYRMIPEMEKLGIIIRKLETPRKFSGAKPETAVEMLTKLKLRNMKEEVDKLEQRQAQITSRLRTIALPVEKSSPSVEVISMQDRILMKLSEMMQNAKQQADVVASLDELRFAYVNRPKKLTERLLGTVKTRAITEKRELDELVKEIIGISKSKNNPIELRQMEELPFNLLIVDRREAMWGELESKNENPQNLWTNDPTQIAILEMSFESLWQKSKA